MSSKAILNKQISTKYAGNLERYESFRRMLEASPLLYQHDYRFYNDDVITRHGRNGQEIKKLVGLIKSGRIEPTMLEFNVFNTYYPSYVLHHHYNVFVSTISSFAESKQAQALAKEAKQLGVIGAFLHEKLRLDFKNADKELPRLENGVIAMDPSTFFYSGVSSPYINHCAFVVLAENGIKLVVLKVRESNGALSNKVIARDMGATVSSDYLSIGYNFQGAIPLFAIDLSPETARKVYSIGLKSRFYQFGFTLKDLHKSLSVTVDYTSMRRQFKTNPDNKEERKIITYQAVAARIINGFALLVAFTGLYSRILEQGKAFLLFSELLESAHHVVLETVIHLRECCGGFGFMQVSGHPGCIERICYRAGLETNKELKLSLEFLQATQYFASSEQTVKYYCQPFSSLTPTFMNYFGVFISIVFNMRKNKGDLSNIEFKREYLKQTFLMSMYAREQFTRHTADNIHCVLMQYAFASYILKNTSFISWEIIKMDKLQFLNGLEKYRNGLLLNLAKQLPLLAETLELPFLRNTIVGRENQESFYEEVLQTSKNNARNDKDYLKYIQAPLVEMLTTNRAKL